MVIGDYPPDYNKALHGPYDPARYYGKPDTAFGQVKLGQLMEWVGRREKTPQSISGLFSRAFWRWQHKYCQPKRAGITYYFQLMAAGSILFYYLNYGKLKWHKNYKYH